jgi:rSAM/selenodomain-associated transferase 1
MIDPHSRLIVFARAPRAGLTKTRLIPRLGKQGAAMLHARLIAHCLRTVTGAGLCPVDLWCTPTGDDPFFQACRERYGVGVYDQGPGDLGTRMHAALASALIDADSAVLIGTDIPGLEASDIDAAFQALHGGADVVLGPARDGGYYLIGMKQADPDVFEGIPWGTSTVYQHTVDRLRQRRWIWRRLREHRDVDTPEDYVELPQTLKCAVRPVEFPWIPLRTGMEK